MKYTGTIKIVDEEGKQVFLRELEDDELIEQLVYGYKKVSMMAIDALLEIPQEDWATPITTTQGNVAPMMDRVSKSVSKKEVKVRGGGRPKEKKYLRQVRPRRAQGKDVRPRARGR